MADTRGVFRLRTLRRENVQGDGVPIDDIWVAPPPTSLTDYGYWTSGTLTSGPDKTSITERTNFATDTTETLPSSPHPLKDYVGQSLTSLTHFYTAGGWDSQTRVQKMSYSSETWTDNPSSQNMIREQRESGTGVGPKTAGYIFMGDDPNYPGPVHSTVQKVLYSVDVWSQLPNFPYQAVYALSGGNQVKAIVGGGNKPSVTSQAYKFTYADETYSSEIYLPPNNSGPGNGERGETASTGNASALWSATGNMPSGITSTVIKFNFDTDSYNSIPGRMSRSRRWAKAAGNPTAGYWAGGSSPAPIYTTMDKLNYSTDTATYTPGANLSQGRNRFYGTAPRMNGLDATTTPGISPSRWSDNWGGTYNGQWYVGGYGPDTGSGRSNAYKISYETDTSSTVSGGSLPNGMYMFASVFNNGINGYISGGNYNKTIGGDGGDGIVRYALPTETASQLPLGSGRRILLNNDMGIANSTAGYAGGGFDEAIPWPYGTQSISRKFTFSTELETMLPGAAWTSSPSPVREAASVGNNSTHGYFMGGITGNPSQPNNAKSDIGKFTYSTETVTTIPANLRADNFDLGTSSDANTGYVYGGLAENWSTRRSWVDKLVFSSDTRSNVPGVNMVTTLSRLNATGDSTVADVVGGYSGPNTYTSYVQKFDIATETLSTIARAAIPYPTTSAGTFGPLAAGKTAIGAPTVTATPNFTNVFPPNISNNGYIMKGWDGQNPSVFNSWILKMDMTTDTRSIPGSMPSPGRYNSASSSQTAAYSAGGPYTPGTGEHGSKTEKLTYSTESAALLPGANAGNVSDAIGYGTADKGYSAFGYKKSGGDQWANNSQVRKLTYSSETWTTLPGNFGYAGIQRGAFNDKKNAYFLGLPGGRAWKMDLTTDSWSTPAQMPAAATWSPTFQGSGGTTGNGDGDKAGYKSGQSGQTADKLTYSTETIAAVPSAAYPGPNGGNRTFGSKVAGYWNSPGQNPGTKLVYSTETFTEIPGYWDVSNPGNPSGTLRDGAGTSALGNSVGSTAIPNNL